VLYSIFSLIVTTVASFLGGVLLLRFWMQAIRVRPPMSLAQFTYQLTDWMVHPLRKILPGVGGYDWASLVGALLIAMLSTVPEIWLLPQWSAQHMLPLALLRLVQWMLYGLMGLIFIGVIFSWVNPYAPLAPFIRALSEPIQRPLRRIIPPVGAIDLTPLVVLLLLQIALYVATALIVSLI